MNTYKSIKYQIPDDITLVVVSKMQSPEKIRKIYDLGHRDFGENKVQELLKKKLKLPKDIRWHFIGHLQTKKVKQILPFITLIQSVDRLTLIEEIQRQAKKIKANIGVLLQLKVAQEESKYGLDKKEFYQIILLYQKKIFPNVIIEGIMGIATFTDNKNQIQTEFLILKNYFEYIKKEIPSVRILSIGMSNDYEIAISSGSNMLRIGSSIFMIMQYTVIILLF